MATAPATAMQLELGKTYKTRNGSKIRVEGIDGNGIAYCSVNNGQDSNIRYEANTGRCRGSSSYDVVCAEPELMFSFRRSPPEHSVTVSETELRRYIEDARAYGGFSAICDAAERMIELAKIKPVSYTYPKPETAMCGPETNSKLIADQAAKELADMLKRDVGIEIAPVLLRLWLVERWGKVAELAHKIHGSAG